ncbi:uncharacterized protein BDZ99DRAFT_403410 [Mytilinidion resinicola]|uniref:Uncharacterized protein n=1 Tax=Mytilinidion resinicola TaxID=574789 RepID=A0A6A6XY46_9PEZI|nr:uncharacterized protein BDZ99DRAFT_403410 [Mytilinidion resinicola]KAF2801412.1 hypothetical protein BDZ99DRAFT_403410 [Mytilinidion resinicola]
MSFISLESSNQDLLSLQSSDNDKCITGPPPLPYNLREHKKSIAVQWSIIVFVSCVFQIVLFYALWFGTNIDHHTVFTITQVILGIFAIQGWAVRLWRLLKKNTTATPLGSFRRYLDFFQLSFLGGFVISTLELVIGSLPEKPNLRLMAMPASSLLFYVGAQLLLVTLLHMGGYPSPARLSSMSKGSVFRPGLYILIEDIVAVDGGGGVAYRKALNARYEASPMFGRLLLHLSMFWSVGALATAIIVTILVYTINEGVAYGIGWGIPFIWAGLWSIITVKWTQTALAREEKWFRRDAPGRNDSV